VQQSNGSSASPPVQQIAPESKSVASSSHNSNTPATAVPITSSAAALSPGGPTFGIDLGEQLARDGTEVPRVVEKCAQAIEAYGELNQTVRIPS